MTTVPVYEHTLELRLLIDDPSILSSGARLCIQEMDVLLSNLNSTQNQAVGVTLSESNTYFYQFGCSIVKFFGLSSPDDIMGPSIMAKSMNVQSLISGLNKCIPMISAMHMLLVADKPLSDDIQSRYDSSGLWMYQTREAERVASILTSCQKSGLRTLAERKVEEAMEVFITLLSPTYLHPGESYTITARPVNYVNWSGMYEEYFSTYTGVAGTLGAKTLVSCSELQAVEGSEDTSVVAQIGSYSYEPAGFNGAIKLNTEQFPARVSLSMTDVFKKTSFLKAKVTSGDESLNVNIVNDYKFALVTVDVAKGKWLDGKSDPTISMCKSSIDLNFLISFYQPDSGAALWTSLNSNGAVIDAYAIIGVIDSTNTFKGKKRVTLEIVGGMSTAVSDNSVSIRGNGTIDHDATVKPAMFIRFAIARANGRSGVPVSTMCIVSDHRISTTISMSINTMAKPTYSTEDGLQPCLDKTMVLCDYPLSIVGQETSSFGTIDTIKRCTILPIVLRNLKVFSLILAKFGYIGPMSVNILSTEVAKLDYKQRGQLLSYVSSCSESLSLEVAKLFV